MDAELRIVLDMTLLMVISGLCSLVFAKIRMPPILGYLTAGIILGPTMFPQLWVEQTTVVVLSNIGIVMLMFWIGLEQSASKLKRVGSRLVLIVTMEMTLVVIIGYLGGMVMGLGSTASIFLGAIISGTSTAVVVGVLQASKTIDGEQATAIMSITVFEDVGQVIILSMAAPLLAGDSPALGSTVNMVIGLIIFFGLSIMMGLAFVPRIMDRIGDRYPSEMVFIVATGMAFTMALLSSSVGLSIAIGPFLIGLIVSMSLYSERIKAKVIPVKELFMAVFFISIGLQIDPRMILDNLTLVVSIAALFIFGKMVAVAVSTYMFGFKAKDSFVVAVSLVAMGEFAFIIAKIALDAGLLSQELYSSVIGAALITMITLPLASKFQGRIFSGLVRVTPGKLRSALARMDSVKEVATARNVMMSDDRRRLGGHLTRIFMDYLYIVLILLVFNLVSGLESAIEEVAGDLGLLPGAALLFIMLLAISPAVVSIYLQLRKVTASLTDMAMRSRRIAEGDRKNVYRMFTDIGEIVMFVLVMALLVPFVPAGMFTAPLLFLTIAIGVAVVALLARDALKSSYVRFLEMVISSGREDGAEEEE
ncbi:MAG: cation:proton antiporter [Euryarchaeota archaeon]|nr:cation:proton antiporter [Euryarchaeota archaeon]